MISHGKAINRKCSFSHKFSFKSVPGMATLIGFGILLAKTSKMKKSTFLTNKYTKLKLRHWPKWYLTQKVWIQSYMMLLISLNFTVFIIFVDLLSKYTFIYAGLPIENELKTASKQPIAKNLKVPTRN